MLLDASVRRHENPSLLLDVGNEACMATKSHEDQLPAQKPAQANRILRDRVITDMSLTFYYMDSMNVREWQ